MSELMEHRTVVRAAHGRAVAGVAAGIAEHLGLQPIVVRIVFVLLTVASGVGLVMYAAFWVLVPQADDPVRLRGADRAQLIALAALAAGVLLLLDVAGIGIGPPTILAVGTAATGVALVWSQVDQTQRSRWRSTARSGPGGWVGVLAGAGLLIAGGAGFLASRGELQEARDGLLATFVVVVGLAVLTGPWWWRMADELRQERRERIRVQERAELAAQVHDSVLQTLALIRKAADDPREVSRLARGQERQLRSWLYPSAGADRSTLRTALERTAAEVEENFGGAVELVVVSDCATTERVQALVAATREALVNATVHAGVESVSVYAEVLPDRVEVFVRDRGKGFDPAVVAGDRHGVADSIIGRMQRHGGSATVRSAPGEGTEVRLECPRD